MSRASMNVVLLKRPGRYPAAHLQNESVEKTPQDADGKDADDDGIRTGEHFRIVDHVAEARCRRHEFRADERPETEPEGEAHSREHVGKDRRKKNRAENRPPGEAEGAPHLDELSVTGRDATERVQKNRKEGGQDDHGDLGRLADSQPQDEKRNERQRRRVSEEVQNRKKRSASSRKEAEEHPQRKPSGKSEPRADEYTPETGLKMPEERSVQQQREKRLAHRLGRGEKKRIPPAEDGACLPQKKQKKRGQKKREATHKRTS